MVETVLGMTDLQIKLVAAAGQLALTATVAYVAWQQWRTARNKLKADLFDRRFAAFEELRRTVSTFRNLQHMPEADAILALAPTFQYLFGTPVSQDVLQLGGSAMLIAQIRRDLALPPDLIGREVNPAQRDNWEAAESEISEAFERFNARYLAVIAGTRVALRLEH
ncbi:TPA: hypothetical protein ACKP89_000525 [Stenotrophomonas maltophilia]|uniref:Transmembrane protein n=2 Tax=Stenotrophomonas maltophilia TaxID=40324 RepID=B2FMT6_STRMK|nr:hypothetical protein [Stenotrophomonas maltophilia]MBH1697522.1 hypothetical protein [Stenotrophomonas maltophilia]MBH1710538.1 hypothetical protein [Stenotrophomonas maltophilia]PZS93783.1 hypothetical protein A7X83_05490 [Stenotrophomonas maltophilia]QGM09453.1 hypothetical protein FEO84_09045 [Stenotrophomonas maltophilia]QNG74294.1 hypothetical protein EIELFIGP_03134 [Stenotrophomonas maltophilia]